MLTEKKFFSIRPAFSLTKLNKHRGMDAMNNYPFHLEPLQKQIEAEMQPDSAKTFCQNCKVFFYTDTKCQCQSALNPEQNLSHTSVLSVQGFLFTGDSNE